MLKGHSPMTEIVPTETPAADGPLEESDFNATVGSATRIRVHAGEKNPLKSYLIIGTDHRSYSTFGDPADLCRLDDAIGARRQELGYDRPEMILLAEAGREIAVLRAELAEARQELARLGEELAHITAPAEAESAPAVVAIPTPAGSSPATTSQQETTERPLAVDQTPVASESEVPADPAGQQPLTFEVVRSAAARATTNALGWLQTTPEQVADLTTAQKRAAAKAARLLAQALKILDEAGLSADGSDQ